jgi:hypothetical protein
MLPEMTHPPRSIATWAILPLYIVLAVGLTWPVVATFRTAIPSSGTAFDPSMQAFLLGWDAHAMAVAPTRVFQAPIFVPEPNTLTYMDHMIGETVTAAPAFLMFGTVAAAYDLLFLLSFAASGWATYRLTRWLGAPRPAAFLSGLLFAFCPYRFGNLDLLNQLQTQFLVLGIWFGLRYLERARPRDLVGAAASFVVQVYFGWYYALYLIVALGVLVLFALATKRAVRPRWGLLFVVSLLSVLIVAPVAVPYLLEHRGLPEFRRTLGESALYSADVLDYFKVNANARISSKVFPVGSQPYWPGLVGVALALVGAWNAWARRLRGAIALAALSAACWVFSLGPILHVAGGRIWIPLPYAALYYMVPGFSGMRAPARFAVLVTLGVSVLAGLGYNALQERWKSRRIRRGTVAAASFALAILFVWPKPLTTVTLPSNERLPPVYHYLRSTPGREPVIEFPVPAWEGDENQTQAVRQFCILFHQHPRLDGVSGFVSRRYRAFRRNVQGFPSHDALRLMDSMGARWVIIHYADYPTEEGRRLRQEVLREPSLRLAAEFGDDAVYELRPI